MRGLKSHVVDLKGPTLLPVLGEGAPHILEINDLERGFNFIVFYLTIRNEFTVFLVESLVKISESLPELTFAEQANLSHVSLV